jgi:hypothetical protein
MWALGKVVELCQGDRHQTYASALFERALPACETFTSPRSIAFSLLGFNAYLNVFSGDSGVRRLREKLGQSLFNLFQNGSNDWPWPENILTYDNARLCQSLISTGIALEQTAYIEQGLKSLAWLMDVQFEKNTFVPIGCTGWYERGKEKARFDQQPLEACASVEACALAYTVTKSEQWRRYVTNTFNWYLGNNDLNMAVYDDKTGGCHDGLESNGINSNQGAESTLSWLQALIAVHAMYADDNLIEQKVGTLQKEVNV